MQARHWRNRRRPNPDGLPGCSRCRPAGSGRSGRRPPEPPSRRSGRPRFGNREPPGGSASRKPPNTSLQAIWFITTLMANFPYYDQRRPLDASTMRILRRLAGRCGMTSSPGRMVRRSFGRPRHHQARKNYTPGKINPTAGSRRRAVYQSRFGCPNTVRAVPFPGRRRGEVHFRWKATTRQHQDGAPGGGPATMARRAVSQSSHCPALGTGSARPRAAGPLNPGTEGRHRLESGMATARFKFKPSRDLSACCRPPPTPTRAT